MCAGKCILVKMHGPETPQPMLQFMTLATIPAASSALVPGLATNEVDPEHKLQH